MAGFSELAASLAAIPNLSPVLATVVAARATGGPRGSDEVTNAASVGTHDPPNAGPVVQSVTEIQAYSQTMANASVFASSPASATLAAAKTDAVAWYNDVYPAYLDLPATLLQLSPTVTGGLTALSSLATQYASTPSPQVRQGIDQEAAALATTVTQMRQQEGALTASLQTSGSNLADDTPKLHNAAQASGSYANGVQAQLGAAYGQLQSLEGAACPDNNATQACEMTTATLQQQLETATDDYSTVSGAASSASNAHTGVAYLVGYWSAVGSDASACVSALQRMQADPDAAVRTDLQATQQAWTGIQQQFRALSTQLSGPTFRAAAP